MFGTLGGPEVVLILVVALIVFGPRKLPEIGKSAGKMLAEFRKASTEFRRTIEDEVEAEKLRETASTAPAVLAPPAVAEPAPVIQPAEGAVQRGATAEVEPQPAPTEPSKPA